MSLKDLLTIDMALGPTPQAKCTLIIVDGDDHTDQDRRFARLTQKLKTYLSYIQSPQFSQDHPHVDICDVLIGVICQQAPSDAMRQITSIQLPKNPDVVVRIAVAQHTLGNELPWFLVPATTR